MYHNSDSFYTDGGYLQNNPGWNQEDSRMKAELVARFIREFNIPCRHVVEVGCGAGEILVELSRMIPENSLLSGYDISQHAIDMARAKENPRISFYHGDFTRMAVEKADLLLVLDVLEHIDDVYSFLRKIRDRADHFIFHIPLDMSCRTVFKPHVLLQQRISVGHIHYFTEETAIWMLKDVGFSVEHYIYTKPDIDLKKPDSIKQWLKKILRKLSYTISPRSSVRLWGGYSILVFAKPALKPA